MGVSPLRQVSSPECLPPSFWNFSVGRTGITNERILVPKGRRGLLERGNI